MYGSKNVRNNQPDLQAHWFIANYVVAAVDEPERADRAMEALRYAGFHVVVATAVGGIPEQVSHGMDEKACWCRRATTTPLARLIMTFLGDPQLAQRLG
jgi:hypothetical protein